VTTIPLLQPEHVGFPNPQQALNEPDGLLAAGGDLSVEWLLCAYTSGIFPWFDSDDEPILWWSPAQRAILRPGAMHVSRSLRKRIINGGFKVTFDQCFGAVVHQCSQPRASSTGTWITAAMSDAYQTLHQEGYAHSLEVWHQDQLCGGLYGVSVGHAFCGESMFSIEKDASKVAFYALQRQLQAWRFTLLDCQILNPHLASLGVEEISRASFLSELATATSHETRRGLWQFDNPSAIF